MANVMSLPLLSGSADFPIGYLGILADWKNFKIDINDFFEEVQRSLGSGIIHSELRSALHKLAVRGETLLQARKSQQDAIVAYHREFAEVATRLARKAKIEARKSITSDKKVPKQSTRHVSLLSDLSVASRLEL